MNESIAQALVDLINSTQGVHIKLGEVFKTDVNTSCKFENNVLWTKYADEEWDTDYGGALRSLIYGTWIVEEEC